MSRIKTVVVLVPLAMAAMSGVVGPGNQTLPADYTCQRAA